MIYVFNLERVDIWFTVVDIVQWKGVKKKRKHVVNSKGDNLEGGTIGISVEGEEVY